LLPSALLKASLPCKRNKRRQLSFYKFPTTMANYTTPVHEKDLSEVVPHLRQ